MDKIRILALGDFVGVTANMFVYHYLPDGKEKNDQILIVDCGMGFPERNILGVDLIIPDFEYVLSRKNKIQAIVLSHGHEDHIGALPFLLPDLPNNIPVYGSRLAAALVRGKLEEKGISGRVEEYNENKQINAGKFKIDSARVNHSLPDTYHLFIQTPSGNFYHGTDFKLDFTPPDGVLPQVSKIADFGKKGVRCLLSDCLGSEKRGHSPSETILNQTFNEEIHRSKGRVFITAISSNIYRWEAAIEASKRDGRKIALVGMSIQKNVEIARKLGYLKNLHADDITSYHQAIKMPVDKVTFLIAGSLGQTGSSLDRVVLGKHKIKVKEGDKFIFSSPDYVPGTSGAVAQLINELFKQGAEVVYEELGETLHVSGHGYQRELSLLADLVKPDYYLPIGGEWRHAHKYRELIGKMGVDEKRVIIPRDEVVPTFAANGELDMSYHHQNRRVLIDGLGIGDVGKTVLRDRRNLAEDGIIVIIMLIDSQNYKLTDKPTVASRGFVYLKESKQLLAEIEKKAGRVYNQAKKPTFNYQTVRYEVQGQLEEFVKSKTGREPIILPVILEV